VLVGMLFSREVTRRETTKPRKDFFPTCLSTVRQDGKVRLSPGLRSLNIFPVHEIFKQRQKSESHFVFLFCFSFAPLFRQDTEKEKLLTMPAKSSLLEEEKALEERFNASEGK